MKITAVIKTALASVVLLAAPYAAHAQIMKCVGKDGRIEFASSCPPGTKQSDTGVSNKPAATSPRDEKGAKGAEKGSDKSAPKSLADREAEFRKRQTEQASAAAKAEKDAQIKADQQRACEAARTNLASVKSRQRMFRVDQKTGERIAYEDADYTREQALAERQITENCK